MADEKKVRIKFIEPHTVQDARVGTPDEESYKKGDRAAVSESSAAHFVSRGKAVLVVAARKKAAK